jgi:tight adherence protein B
MDSRGISIIVFAASVLLVLGIYYLRTSGERMVAGRIKKISEIKKKMTENRQVEHSGLLRKLLSAVSGIFIARRLGKLVDKKLEEADILLSGGEFVVIVVALFIISSLFSFIITLNTITSIVIGFIAGAVPFFTVDSARVKRMANFNAQISDALTIMANSLRSGFSFLQAMDMVQRELPDPIKKEFFRTFREINLGTSTEEALQNLVKRVGSDDLDLVITAVLIQRQVGGNLAEVLDNIAETLRERMRVKREVRTLTAQGRISGLIIQLLPAFLAAFLFFTNRPYIMELFTDRLGQIMLTVALVNEAIGIYLIRKIVDINL